jgi:hypothetical protein
MMLTNSEDMGDRGPESGRDPASKEREPFALFENSA